MYRFSEKVCVKCDEKFNHDSWRHQQTKGYCLGCAKKSDETIEKLCKETYVSKYPNFRIKIRYSVSGANSLVGGYESDPDLENIPDYEFTTTFPVLNNFPESEVFIGNVIADNLPSQYLGYPVLSRYSTGKTEFNYRMFQDIPEECDLGGCPEYSDLGVYSISAKIIASD